MGSCKIILGLVFSGIGVCVSFSTFYFFLAANYHAAVWALISGKNKLIGKINFEPLTPKIIPKLLSRGNSDGRLLGNINNNLHYGFWKQSFGQVSSLSRVYTRPM